MSPLLYPCHPPGSWANADPDRPWEWESGLTERVFASAKETLILSHARAKERQKYESTSSQINSVSGSGSSDSFGDSDSGQEGATDGSSATAMAATIAAAAAADPDWNREARRPTFVTIPLVGRRNYQTIRRVRGTHVLDLQPAAVS